MDLRQVEQGFFFIILAYLMIFQNWYMPKLLCEILKNHRRFQMKKMKKSLVQFALNSFLADSVYPKIRFRVLDPDPSLASVTVV